MTNEGKILTFYSYKGGTGRSMCLANTAWLLASAGYKVLVIDWDLEAPGLHRYFRPFLTDPDLFETNGLIDAVWTLAVQLFKAPENDLDPHSTMTTQELVEFFDDYICVLEWEFKKGSIGFIGAGRQDFSYAERVNTFDWKRFYELGGGDLLNRAKALWRTTFDFVLIDSRTGVSDTSGICTIQMPDALVACFTLNRQSIEGGAAVLASVHSQRQARSPSNAQPVDFFPLAMRIENAEKTKLDNARGLTRRTFSPWLPSRYKRGDRRYWDQMEITYWPFYAYEEVLAAFGDTGGMTGSAKTLLSELEVMARCITGLRQLQAPVISDDIRRKILLEYSFGPIAEEPVPVRSIPSEGSSRSSSDGYRGKWPAYEGTSGFAGKGELAVFISCARNGTLIADVVSRSISELSYGARVFTSAAFSAGTDWRMMQDHLSQSAILLLIYTPGDDLSYSSYELGLFLNINAARGEGPRVIILMSDYERGIPAVFQRFQTISFSKDSSKAGISAIANLGRLIVELSEPERMNTPQMQEMIVQWAPRTTEAIGAAINSAYNDTVSRGADFQHSLVFTMRDIFDEDVDVQTTSTTLQLFGLSATDQIKWHVLKRSLSADENRWWAEELEEMITDALRGRTPALATQFFVASDRSLYRSVIERFTVTRGGVYTVTVLLLEMQIERSAFDLQVASSQVLLAVSRYQKEVVHWGLDNLTIIGGPEEDRYWRELDRRVKGALSSAVAGGLGGPEWLRPIAERNDTLAQIMNVWQRNQHELLLIVDKGQRKDHPEGKWLLAVLNDQQEMCSRVITELALEIGASAESRHAPT
jgi:hypothetical protein